MLFYKRFNHFFNGSLCAYSSREIYALILGRSIFYDGKIVIDVVIINAPVPIIGFPLFRIFKPVIIGKLQELAVEQLMERYLFGKRLRRKVTISQNPSGKYFASVLVEQEYLPLPTTGSAIGLDLGIKDLVITSNGKKYDNPKTLAKYENKLVREQRKLEHKQKGSQNKEKQRIRLAKVYEKIHNIRLDYLHKTSNEIINENQVIASEDLAVSNMMKNHKLAKSISDCGWYELTWQLDYKAKWNNRQHIKIGRFVPSSQICIAGRLYRCSTSA